MAGCTLALASWSGGNARCRRKSRSQLPSGSTSHGFFVERPGLRNLWLQVVLVLERFLAWHGRPWSGIRVKCHHLLGRNATAVLIVRLQELGGPAANPSVRIRCRVRSATGIGYRSRSTKYEVHLEAGPMFSGSSAFSRNYQPETHETWRTLSRKRAVANGRGQTGLKGGDCSVVVCRNPKGSRFWIRGRCSASRGAEATSDSNPILR